MSIITLALSWSADDSGVVIATFTDVLSTFMSNLTYALSWLEGHSEAVIATFTGVLAISTIALWSAIKRLGKANDQALVAAQRAFISVVVMHNANGDIATGQINHWRFTPVWQNTGNTPTRNMKSHASIQWRDQELPESWDFPDQWSAGESHVAAPLSGSARSAIAGHSVYVPVDVVADVIDRKKFLYLWGWASYNDVFPRTAKHLTRFAVRIVVAGNARNSDKISFNYEHLARYNCSDEECEYQGFPASWQAREIDLQ